MINNEIIRKRLAKRYAKERRFRLYGVAFIIISIAFLLTLLVNISLNGLPVFQQTYINLEANLDEDIFGVISNSNDK